MNTMTRSFTLGFCLLMLLGVGMMFSSCHQAYAADEPTAVATPTPDQNPSTDTSPQDVARNIYDAVRAGRWMAAIGGVLMLIVWAVRKIGINKRIKWFSTATGGRVLAFGIALLATLGTAFVAKEPPNLSLFAGALAAAWTASGQWEDVKDTKTSAKRRAPTGPMKAESDPSA